MGKVCFTGSVGGGKEIARIAASAVTPVTLELGGNDAAIIFDDAQLDTVSLDRLFSSIFDTSGQICMNAKRIYVHESRKDELLAGLRERLAGVKLGHGLDEGVTHGPLHTARQAEWVSALISEARDAGATVEQFGDLPDGELADGHFVLPSLVIDPDPSLRIVTEEQFGPAIPIITFATEAEAVEAANDTWAGLGASVWTEDPARATRVAEKLDAGYVWINDHGAPRLDLRAPFGGTKFSGYGREQGIEGVLEFTQTRAVSRHVGDR
jgi:acyl-CoA reductase-like NAD-dependent aldehyde dehydrogenase